MIIDVFSHHISESVSKKGLPYDFGIIKANADPEARLALMDKYGIDMHVLVQTAPVLLGFNAKEAAEICRQSNDDNFALCKKHPKRFVNVCILSLLDIRSAMKELDRCINELDCRGITVGTNQKGKGLDSPEYFPLYEKLAEKELPLFLHPMDWNSYPLVNMDEGWRAMIVFGWPFDTTQAIWRIILGGVLDRFPTLKIVTHHLGAMLPYFSRRFETNLRIFFKDRLKRPIPEYWKQIYGDTATDGTAAAFPCGFSFFGPDRMMYGTDYPFGLEAGEDFIRENLACIQAMEIPEAQKKKILGGNAKKLLKIR